MKLKDLIKKLQGKPKQNEEVDFIVYSTVGGVLVCAEMSGPATHDIMKALSKHAPKPAAE